MEKYQISQEIDLDLQQGDAPPLVKAVQYDDSCRVIAATIHNAGQLYAIPADTLVTFQMVKKDGNAIENRCSFTGSVVYAILTKQTLAFAGKYTARLCFYSPGGPSVRSMQITLSIGDGVNTDVNFVSLPESESIVELSARIIEASNLAAGSAAAAAASEAAAVGSAEEAADSKDAANNSATIALKAKQDSETALGATNEAKEDAIAAKAGSEAAQASSAESADEAKKWAQTAAGPQTVVLSVNPDDGGIDITYTQA